MTPPSRSASGPRRSAADRRSARQRSITEKPLSYRRAVAEGELLLSARSRSAIRAGSVEKGDPRSASALAGMSAMKRTAELLPHCHIVPLTWSRVEVELSSRGVRVRSEVEARWSTGVEMEALVGATVALLTVWDMVKYLEKDARGAYPRTALGPVRVVEKVKRPLGETAER